MNTFCSFSSSLLYDQTTHTTSHHQSRVKSLFWARCTVLLHRPPSTKHFLLEYNNNDIFPIFTRKDTPLLRLHARRFFDPGLMNHFYLKRRHIIIANVRSIWAKYIYNISTLKDLYKTQNSWQAFHSVRTEFFCRKMDKILEQCVLTVNNHSGTHFILENVTCWHFATWHVYRENLKRSCFTA